MNIHSLCVLVGCGLVAGCAPSSGTVDAGGGVANEGECRRNIECGGGSICRKAPAEDEGVCVPFDCFTERDSIHCGEGCGCDVQRGICVCSPPCVPSVDLACDVGAVCLLSGREGACHPVDELPAAVACEAWPAVAHVRAGGTMLVSLLAVDDVLAPVPYGSCELSVTTADVSCEQPLCLASAAVSTCGRTECSAQRRIYEVLPSSAARVVVVEEGSEAPLQGVRVVVRSGAQLFEATTTADGVVRFDDVGVVESVSVLPDGHEWHTLIGNARDVLVATRRVTRADVVSAALASFDFSDVTTQGDVRIAGGGVSLPDLSRLSANALFGDIENATLVLEGVTDADGAPMAMTAGTVFEIAAESQKGTALFVGAEGHRIPWAIGGRSRLSLIGDILAAPLDPGEPLIDLVGILELMTVWGTADHALASTVELQPRTRPEELRHPYPDVHSAQLVGADAMVLDTYASGHVRVSAPRLPCPPSSPACSDDEMEQVLLVTLLADVPGRGSVPLGLFVGRDDPVPNDELDLRDGVIDAVYRETAVPSGEVPLSFAPPHDGLEGSELVLAAFSVGPTIAGIPSVTGALRRMVTVPVQPSLPELLPYARGFVDGLTVTFDDVGADLQRIELRSDDATWHVWLRRGAVTVDLAGLLPPDVAAPEGSIALTALVLDEGDDVTPASLFDLGRGGASSLQHDLRAWSTVGCGEGSSCVIQ